MKHIMQITCARKCPARAYDADEIAKLIREALDILASIVATLTSIEALRELKAGEGAS